MRKVYLALLCALILAEGVMLYGLYEQYEALAAEKNAVERRADVLKTLFDQTEKELETEKGKWLAEKQALLNTQNELKQELAGNHADTASVSAALPPDYSGLLQGLYTQLYVGAEGALGEMHSIFQGILPQDSVTPAPTVSPAPTEKTDALTEAMPIQSLSPVHLQKTWD